MIPYIVLAIVCIAVSTQIRKQEDAGMGLLTRQQALTRVCLLTLFLLLFGLSACRYMVGNDYPRYLEFFHLIPLDQVVPTEFGFNYIVLFMQFLFGEDASISIFALFAFATVFFMLKAIYDQSEDFASSFFLFLMLGYYFNSMNTVRYYVAWAVALWSMKFVLKKQYGKFILAILPAATIHKSVLVVIPLYILCNMAWKAWFYALLAVGGVLAYVFQGYVLKAILLVYSSYENTSYLDGGTSLINVLRITAVLVLSLICYKWAIKDNAQNRLYFHLNILALLLYTCGSFIPEISRIGYYLTAGHIFLIPSLVRRIPQPLLRKGAMILTVVAALLYFAMYLIKAQDLLVRVVPYHTWILPGDVSA